MSEFICIVCPNGCRLQAEKVGEEIKVYGNKCKRGEAFAKEELTSPKRSVTTTVATTVKGYPVVSVRTDGEIPKDKVKELIKLANAVLLERPYKRGEIVLENLFETGINLIITTDME